MGFGYGLLAACVFLVIGYSVQKSKWSNNEKKLQSEISILQERVDELELVSAEPPPTQQPDGNDQKDDDIIETPTEAASTEKIPDPTESAVTETPMNATEEPPVVDESVTIVIANGMDSHTIARLLRNNGVIDDTDAFITYLSRNKYTERIRAGTFTLQKNMTYENVVKKIIY